MIKVKVDIAGINRKINVEAKKRQQDTLNKVLVALKEATPVDTGAARDGWVVEDGVILNKVEYIDVLNGGHSSQAPSHFAEKAVLSVPGVVPNGIIIETTR